MLYVLLVMTLILSVSVGNLALGFGLAVHLGHGPAGGWKALCFWTKDAAVPHAEQPKAEESTQALAHH
jgi:hypothetical protein